MEPAREPLEPGNTAFERALRPHHDALHRLALRLTGSPDDADDLMQDLFAHLYPRAATVVSLDRPRPWLMRVLYRLFVDRWRHRRADPVVADNDGVEDYPANALDAPDVVFERQLTAARLQAGLDALPPAQRDLLLLHDVEGYTLPEVAEVLEVPLGTLKSRLHRGRAGLRAILLGRGGTLEAPHP